MAQNLKSIREKLQRRAYKALTSYILQERRYPYIESPEAFVSENSKHFLSPENAKLTSLDLGCGTKLRNTFGADEVFGVDIRGNIE
jgi:SAM-dependent methyltransferase